MKGLVTRHSSHVTGRRPTAFTLVELLVVIAIIVVLAGLGFAGMQGAINSGKKAQARNDVHQAASAVKAYLLEYGRLPEQEDIWKTLTGENSKKIVFLEAKAAKGDKGGYNSGTGQLLDPWGKEYQVQLDDDYNNKVDFNGAEHLTTVVVYSQGDGKSGVISNVQ